MSDDYQYKLTYQLQAHPKGLALKDFNPPESGGADGVLMASILFPPDGSLSVQFVSLDGRTGNDLSFEEKFKVWAMLAHTLASDGDATPGKKALCQKVHETIKEALTASRIKEALTASRIKEALTASRENKTP